MFAITSVSNISSQYVVFKSLSNGDLSDVKRKYSHVLIELLSMDEFLLWA